MGLPQIPPCGGASMHWVYLLWIVLGLEEVRQELLECSGSLEMIEKIVKLQREKKLLANALLLWW